MCIVYVHIKGTNEVHLMYHCSDTEMYRSVPFNCQGVAAKTVRFLMARLLIIVLCCFNACHRLMRRNISLSPPRNSRPDSYQVSSLPLCVLYNLELDLSVLFFLLLPFLLLL